MAQSITIKIENNSEHDSGGLVGAQAGSSLPNPVVNGTGPGGDLPAMAVPTPLNGAGYVAQADMAVPSPSTHFLPETSAGTANIPTPLSGGAFGGATTAPVPSETMLPGGFDDQAPIPLPDMTPDAGEAGKSSSDEGAGRKAKK